MLNIVGKWKAVMMDFPFGDLEGRHPIEECAAEAAKNDDSFMFDKTVLKFNADNTMTLILTEDGESFTQGGTWWEKDGELFYDSNYGDSGEDSGFTAEEIEELNHLVVEGDSIIQNMVFAKVILERCE